MDAIVEFFSEAVPTEWAPAGPAVRWDRDEIMVILKPAGVGDMGGVKAFRLETRERRIAIAELAQQRFERPVSWGVEVGDATVLFTHLSVPTMTRLRLSERKVLDTLVASGVARSRSDALAWCVKLVGRHEAEWLAELRQALRQVDAVRARGPASERDGGAR